MLYYTLQSRGRKHLARLRVTVLGFPCRAYRIVEFQDLRGQGDEVSILGFLGSVSSFCQKHSLQNLNTKDVPGAFSGSSCINESPPQKQSLEGTNNTLNPKP